MRAASADEQHRRECMTAALALARRADALLRTADGTGGTHGVHLARAMMLGAIDRLEELVVPAVHT